MSVSESTSDPITELDTLTSELASLQRQFSEHKMKQEEFELLSNNIRERISRAEATAYAQARKNEPLARKLRLRSYNDPTIQQVLNHLLAAPTQALEPEFGAEPSSRICCEISRGRKLDSGSANTATDGRYPICERSDV